MPAEMPADCKPEAAVVIDVLRATTIAWALHNGAEAVEAVADLQVSTLRPGSTASPRLPANAANRCWRL